MKPFIVVVMYRTYLLHRQNKDENNSGRIYKLYITVASILWKYLSLKANRVYKDLINRVESKTLQMNYINSFVVVLFIHSYAFIGVFQTVH